MAFEHAESRPPAASTPSRHSVVLPTPASPSSRRAAGPEVVSSRNDDTTATSPSRPNTSRTPDGMRRSLTPMAVPWQAVWRAPTYRMSGPDGTTARGDDDHRPTHRHRARRLPHRVPPGARRDEHGLPGRAGVPET